MSGSDLFTGTLDLLILRTVAGSPLHGYAIGRAIREGSSGILDPEEGALYPALHRLERRGLLTSDWDRTDTGRRARFYRLTADGRVHLSTERGRWSDYARAVDSILEAGEA